MYGVIESWILIPTIRFDEKDGVCTRWRKKCHDLGLKPRTFYCMAPAKRHFVWYKRHMETVSVFVAQCLILWPNSIEMTSFPEITR